MPEDKLNKQQKFKIKSSIRTKGILLLVCLQLPLILLFIYISQIEKRNEQALTVERNDLEFSTRLNHIASTQALSCAYLLLHLLTNDPRANASWLKNRNATLEQTHKLDQLSRNIVDPQKRKLALQLVRETYLELSRMSQLQPIASAFDLRVTADRMKTMRQYGLNAYRRNQTLQQMDFAEQERLSKAISAGKEKRSRISIVLNCFIFVLLAVSVLLVILFAREITSRLKIVVENGTRLPQREKLNKKLDGTDEISYLDWVLHNAAEKLDEAALFRKNLLEMVAHDMCSPLSAVNISLAILQNTPATIISKSTSEKFSEAGGEIVNLVDRANQLLSIERLCAQSPDLMINSAQVDNPGESNSGDTTNVEQLAKLIRLEFRSAGGRGSSGAEKFRPEIFKKGLIFVLTPLIFGAGMLVFTNFLNQKAASFLDLELKQSEIAIGINRLTVAMVAHMAIVGNYHMYGDNANHSMESDVKALTADYAKKLKSLAADDQLTIAGIDALIALDQKEESRLKGIKPSLNDTRSMPTPAFAIPGKAIMFFSIKKMEKLLELTEHQIERIAVIRQKENELQKTLEMLFQIGIAGSLLLSIFLTLAFDRDITKRLKVLTSNAEMLPTRKPLNASVRGRDEIWYLDSVLHDVAEILDSIWQQRKVFMEVLAEDLRRPLKRAQEALRTIPSCESEKFDDMRQRHFQFANANVERILSLVDALLTIENLEQGKIELVKSQVDARDAAQEAIDSLAALAQNRQVSLLNKCDSIVLNADKGRIIQVLVNFLGNAINHSPANSEIFVETSMSSKLARFDVVDSGPGLSLEMRKKVFERFFQTQDSKTKGTGYGLGLAICRMIAEAHGGTVGCDEASTGGCKFYAVIPTDSTSY